MTTPQFTFNGINGATGKYLHEPMALDDMARAVGNAQVDRNPPSDMRRPIASVDPKYLDQAGWGIIFAAVDREKNLEVREALGPLLTLRQSQAGGLYRLYDGADSYRPDESKNDFLRRFNVGPGPVDPTKMPYYLLLVGSPESIPYEFQSQLDIQFAVGRIYFETPTEYANYAESVVRAETGDIVLPKRAYFFGTQNPDDRATELSATKLMQPLAERMEGLQPAWEIDRSEPKQATKARFRQLLSSPKPPALLFTASHGMAFPKDDLRQLAHQGALLCQDWPGPEAWREPIPEKFYFSADDISDDANVAGMIGFNFACYSGGTPQHDQYDFDDIDADHGTEIAPYPFIARLPQRLLSHPRGGALAVISHIDRAWNYSFQWPGVESQLEAFESTLGELMMAYPVGHAMSYFNERYAELATELNRSMRLLRPSSGRSGARSGGLTDVRQLELIGKWTAHNDARDYMIFGDPAVRLPTGSKSEGRPRSISARLGVNDRQVVLQSDSQVDSQADSQTGSLSRSSFDLFPDSLSVSTYIGDTLLIQTQIRRNGEAENRLSRELVPSDSHSVALHNKTLEEAVNVWRS